MKDTKEEEELQSFLTMLVLMGLVYMDLHLIEHRLTGGRLNSFIHAALVLYSFLLRNDTFHVSKQAPVGIFQRASLKMHRGRSCQ